MRAQAPAILAYLLAGATVTVAQTAPEQRTEPAASDLGVDHATLVAKLRPAYECKEDAPTASTTCTRKAVTVVVQGAGRAKSVTFIVPLDNDEQLAAGSITMVALAQEVFPKWKFGTWYERNLKQARRVGIKFQRDGVQISASPFGKEKDRLLVVWTTEQARVQ